MQDVEVKIAFLERHLVELDGVVRGLATELDRLRRDLLDLREQTQPSEKATLDSEKPPHY